MNSIYDELIRFSPDGLIHNNERLAELQALPLNRKIGVTIARITEWYNAFKGNVYVSISGGKDSAVLWDITNKLFPDVPAVFSNTGLEYPEIQQFARSKCTDVVTPEMSFAEVIKTYGYPIISKEVSEAIYYARRNTPPRKEAEWKRLELTGNRPQISRTEYWQTSCPPRRTHNLFKAKRTARTKKNTILFRRGQGERCLWVASLIRTAAKSLPLIKKNGCPLFIFRSKYLTTVAT